RAPGSCCAPYLLIQRHELANQAWPVVAARIRNPGLDERIPTRGIARQLENRASECSRLVRVAQDRACARHFRQRLSVAADHRTAAGLRFDDGPAEALKARGEQQRECAVVERFEQL